MLPEVMEFGLLGPLVVHRDGIAVPIRRGNQRTLLAALLLDANQLVSTDQIAEMLWGPNPPPSAQVTIRNYVKRLRQDLGDAGHDRIRAEPNGYLISAGADELDLSRFEQLLGSARAAARDGSWDAAADAAGSALALWRGPPLADVESDALASREGTRLAELQLQALETRIEADLHRGRPADVIAELQRLAAAHPLREQLYALLMLALYRCGRQGEALTAYHDARRVLDTELGVEPGPALRELQQRILAADPALSAADPPAPSEEPRQPARSAPVVPRQLPRGSAQFVGRASELAALTAALAQAGAQAPGTVVISAIGGTAGVGKTTLAVHWAHQVAHLFPDGQLHANLRGFGPSGAPATPEEAIRAFLGALGVPADQVPPGLDAQAGLYRSLLADRQMLILLDNARDEQQVRPLLPAAPGCLVIVTSRSQLTGLATAEDARLLTLDVLTGTEARELLASRVGEDRSAADTGAVSEIAGLCARLPLALAVAAARAAASPGLPMAALATELRDTASRLDALDTGDPAASVRAVFSWSYRQLSRTAAEMFRLLGLHPGPDISVPAAASLAGVRPAAARQALSELSRARLISENSAGRYTFHDLLRTYAAELADTEDSPGERQAAILRVLDHYLHTARAARLVVNPHYEQVTVGPPQPGVHPEDIAGYEEAMSWFENEHPVLLAAVSQAADTGLDTQAWQLSTTLTTFLDWRGYWDRYLAVQQTALAAAMRLGDRQAQAITHRFLGKAQSLLGSYQDGHAHFSDALELYRELGDGAGQARVQVDLGALADRQGLCSESLAYCLQALGLFQAAGDRVWQAMVLNNIGWCHAQLGDYGQALVHCEQALTMFTELGNRHAEAYAWDSLGFAHHHLGQHDEAVSCYQQALTLARELGDRHNQAKILTNLGDAHQAADRPSAARDAWQQALGIFDDLHHPSADQIRAKLTIVAGSVPREPVIALSVPRPR